MLVETGSVRSIVPAQQFLVPVAPAPVTCETAQKLVGVEPAFGMGRGGPMRQPAAVQFRLLPVRTALVGPGGAAQPPPRLVICVTSRLRSGRMCGPGAEL